MAVGDVVSDVFTAAGSSITYFQPAAGVEVMITQIAYYTNTSLGCFIVLSDGVGNDPYLGVNSSIYENEEVMKIFVTNSVYLGFDRGAASAIPVGFTGIQLK